MKYAYQVVWADGARSFAPSTEKLERLLLNRLPPKTSVRPVVGGYEIAGGHKVLWIRRERTNLRRRAV